MVRALRSAGSVGALGARPLPDQAPNAFWASALACSSVTSPAMISAAFLGAACVVQNDLTFCAVSLPMVSALPAASWP